MSSSCKSGAGSSGEGESKDLREGEGRDFGGGGSRDLRGAERKGLGGEDALVLGHRALPLHQSSCPSDSHSCSGFMSQFKTTVVICFHMYLHLSLAAALLFTNITLGCLAPGKSESVAPVRSCTSPNRVIKFRGHGGGKSLDDLTVELFDLKKTFVDYLVESGEEENVVESCVTAALDHC